MTDTFVPWGGEANNGTRTATLENQNGYGMKKSMQKMVSRNFCLSRRSNTSVSASTKMQMLVAIARYSSGEYDRLIISVLVIWSSGGPRLAGWKGAALRADDGLVSQEASGEC